MDTQLIFEKLFKRNFSDSQNKHLLEEITNAHPYFSAASFYLLQQTPAGTEVFTKQAAKTTILFNNPYWLNFQLQRSAKPAITTQIPPGNADNNDDDDIVMEKEIEPMKFELKLPPESSNSNDDTLSFEPMHLVDYFASQGIKLSGEELTDKLGKQLKSFTEWLKTMKKLPANDSSQAVMSDVSIQALAEKSNKEDDVITEPMAEVLAKQGKLSKAIELYQKLSLMNPSKSAYFAAKIEQLKDT